MIRRVLFWVAMISLLVIGSLIMAWFSVLLLGPVPTGFGLILNVLFGALWGLVVLYIGFVSWDRWVR